MRFVCDKCGPVQPSIVFYSCPAQADCPICGQHLTEVDGIPVMVAVPPKNEIAEAFADLYWEKRQTIDKAKTAVKTCREQILPENAHSYYGFAKENKALRTLLSDLERILEEK